MRASRRLRALTGRQRQDTRVDRLLAEAGCSVEHPALRLAGLCAGGVACGAVALGPPGAWLGGPAAMVAAFVWLRRRAAARTDRLEAAFPVAVRAMSDTVQAGGNVQQALARACDESSSPMREELQRAIDELSVGVPVDDVLGSFARRCSVPGADVLAVALTSAVRSGADVRPVLECIVDAAVDRRRLRRELRAATAQGRMTALVIGSLPAAFLLVMGAGGGSELRFLFHEPAGVVLVAAGACLEALGFAWMRRLGRAR